MIILTEDIINISIINDFNEREITARIINIIIITRLLSQTYTSQFHTIFSSSPKKLTFMIYYIYRALYIS